MKSSLTIMYKQPHSSGRSLFNIHLLNVITEVIKTNNKLRVNIFYNDHALYSMDLDIMRIIAVCSDTANNYLMADEISNKFRTDGRIKLDKYALYVYHMFVVGIVGSALKQADSSVNIYDIIQSMTTDLRRFE